MATGKLKRNGYEITVKSNISKWLKKAGRAGKLNADFWEIKGRVEECGFVQEYRAKQQFCYPNILLTQEDLK